MHVEVDHAKLTRAADAMDTLIVDLETQANNARQGTPIDLSTLDDHGFKRRIQWLKDQQPMIAGLADIAWLLDSDGNGTSSFEVGGTVADVKALLGETLADTVADHAQSDDPAFTNYLLNELRSQVLPPADGNGWEVGGWAAGRAITGIGAGADFAKFHPYGRFVGPGRHALHTKGYVFRNSGNPNNWQTRPGRNPATRGRLGTTGTWMTRGGSVLSGGLAGYDQWQNDAGDPSMSDDEKVGRTGYRTGAVTAGAWGGAVLGGKGGAMAGAAIGSVFPGPGTAVGAAVGGVVGGIGGALVGSGAANWVVDNTVDKVGDAVDAVVPDFDLPDLF